MPILLLGASGYVGQAFQRALRERRANFLPISRSAVNYYETAELVNFIRETNASFLINAAGYTGKPNVDACEIHRTECLLGNAVLPGVLREACETVGIPWGHVSSGCIYTGHRTDGAGFREDDSPNFCFRTNHCSFYSGTKALGEEVLDGAERCFIWRMRIPFDHRDTPRNYLSKLMHYDRLLDAENSISHLDEFVVACLASWEKRAPFGIYNLTNPGVITTREIVDLIREHLHLEREFHFFASEDEFMRIAAKTPRSNCAMDTSKAEAAGLGMRPVRDALRDALARWEATASRDRITALCGVAESRESLATGFCP